MCRPHKELKEKEVPPAPPPMDESSSSPESGPPAPPPMDDHPPASQMAKPKPESKLATEFDNCSSRVPMNQINEFVEELLKAEELKPPVFSVCDCNSFHTSGYLWAWYAIRKALNRKVGPVAVINIDQHSDKGVKVTYAVKSDGWGDPLMGMLEKKPWNGIGCYLSTPNAKNDQDLSTTSTGNPNPKTPVFPPAESDVINDTGYNVNIKILFDGAIIDKCILTDSKGNESTRPNIMPAKTFVLPAGDKVRFTYEGDNPPNWEWQKIQTPKTKKSNKEDFDNLWSKLRDYLGIKAFEYVFISIDLDCVKENYTQWGDKSSVINDTSDLIEVLKNVTSPLFNKDKANLIGFDITGLPEHPSLSGLPESSARNVWGTIENRIVELQKWAFLNWQPLYPLEEGLDISRKSVNLIEKHDVATNVVFYSGSVSYVKALWDTLAEKWNYRNFTGCIARGLPRLLNSKGWKYILCEQEPPVFIMGRKKFKLYSPDKPVPASIGWPSGDDTGAQRTLQDQLEAGEGLEKGASDALGEGKKIGDGFDCSMSLKGVSEFKPLLKKLRDSKPDLKKFMSKKIKITSSNGPLEPVDDFDFWHTHLLVSSTAIKEVENIIGSNHTTVINPVSPSLKWRPTPEGTKSIAVIAKYADERTTMHTHWVVFNLPGDVTELPENLGASGNIKYEEGINDDGTTGYGQLTQCPKKAGTYNIQFHVYAADIELGLIENKRAEDVLKSIEGHTLGYGSCDAKYAIDGGGGQQ
ncbi:MAG: YbhB/YbcL family Raf kinase inhibitor-like protein [Nitrospinales bacterium]